MAYELDYNDERFQQVTAQGEAAKTELGQTYDNMISQADQFYDKQQTAISDYADKQAQLQQEKTDFAIEQIEQQKEQQRQDYLKEQSGAYVDFQKQSNDYSVGAEQLAANGLVNTGYSESSKVSMFNTYQNRVATARESFNRAILNYDNAIKDARLQNSSILAEIAYNALKEQLELSLQGFQYKNGLILDKVNAIQNLDNTYYSRYQDVLAQLNQEIAFEEQKRQYEETLNEQKRQYDKTMAFNREQFEWQKSKSGSSGRSSRSSSGGSGGVQIGKSNKDIYNSLPKGVFHDVSNASNATNAVRKIENYYNKGVIDEAQAQYLLNKFEKHG